MSVAEWVIRMVFTTEGFFKVAIERWPERDLDPRPLNSTIYRYKISKKNCNYLFVTLSFMYFTIFRQPSDVITKISS